MSTNRISHIGIVDAIVNDCVRVRIIQNAACGSCSAAKLCRSSEQKEKLIDVATPNASDYEIGQEVTVVGSVSQGLKATLWAYVLPLVLMVVAMALTTLSGCTDVIVALSALGVLAVYYLGLFLLRDKMEQKLAFQIKS